MALIADLTTPEVVADVDHVAPETAAFPVPPTAWGFAKTPHQVGDDVEVTGVTAVITGALVVEGDYLEPTTGQIWPR